MVNSFSTRGVPSLSELRDVNITETLDGEALVFDSTTGRYENESVVTTLPVADADTLGGVRIGSGIHVLGGTISVLQSAPTIATGSQLGVVQIGTGLDITEGGLLSVPAQQIPLATASTPGLVTIGSGINLNSGEISVTPQAPPSLATTSTAGLVQIGTGINVSNGVISIAGGGSPEYFHAELAGIKYVGNETAQDPTGATLSGFNQNVFQSPSGQVVNGAYWQVPSSGVWRVTYTAHADLQFDVANFVRCEAHIVKNGSEIKSNIIDLQPTGGGTSGETLRGVSLVVTSLLNLTANDQLYYKFACTGASGIAQVKPTLTWIDGQKVS